MSLPDLSPKSVFITGCNKGIGLELVRQFLKLPNPPRHLFVTYRDPATAGELQTLSKENATLHLIKLDVTEYDALPAVVQRVSETLEGDGLNLLINNAGTAQWTAELDTVTPGEMRQDYEVNAIAPLMVTKAFLPLLKKAAATAGGSGKSCTKSAVINSSTILASCAKNDDGGMSYSYRASKCALSMVTRNLSVDLRETGVLVVQIDPGWVQTDMGGSEAFLTPQMSCERVLLVLAALGDDKHGASLDNMGKDLPW